MVGPSLHVAEHRAKKHGRRRSVAGLGRPSERGPRSPDSTAADLRERFQDLTSSETPIGRQTRELRQRMADIQSV